MTYLPRPRQHRRGAPSGSANTIAFNGEDGVGQIRPNSAPATASLQLDFLQRRAGHRPRAAPRTPRRHQERSRRPGYRSQQPPEQADPNLRRDLRQQDHHRGQAQQHPERTFTIRFFSNPSGNEGKKFIGPEAVSTNANGNGPFTFDPGTRSGGTEHNRHGHRAGQHLRVLGAAQGGGELRTSRQRIGAPFPRPERKRGAGHVLTNRQPKCCATARDAEAPHPAPRRRRE